MFAPLRLDLTLPSHDFRRVDNKQLLVIYTPRIACNRGCARRRPSVKALVSWEAAGSPATAILAGSEPVIESLVEPLPTSLADGDR
jgi:hypothetical protein